MLTCGIIFFQLTLDTVHDHTSYWPQDATQSWALTEPQKRIYMLHFVVIKLVIELYYTYPSSTDKLKLLPLLCCYLLDLGLSHQSFLT